MDLKVSEIVLTISCFYQMAMKASAILRRSHPVVPFEYRNKIAQMIEANLHGNVDNFAVGL